MLNGSVGMAPYGRTSSSYNSNSRRDISLCLQRQEEGVVIPSALANSVAGTAHGGGRQEDAGQFGQAGTGGRAKSGPAADPGGPENLLTPLHAAPGLSPLPPGPFRSGQHVLPGDGP